MFISVKVPQLSEQDEFLTCFSLVILEYMPKYIWNIFWTVYNMESKTIKWIKSIHKSVLIIDVTNNWKKLSWVVLVVLVFWYYIIWKKYFPEAFRVPIAFAVWVPDAWDSASDWQAERQWQCHSRQVSLLLVIQKNHHHPNQVEDIQLAWNNHGVWINEAMFPTLSDRRQVWIMQRAGK